MGFQLCCKPDSVQNHQSHWQFLYDHSSGIEITFDLKRPDPRALRGSRFLCSPIWSCSAQSLAVFTPAAPLESPVPDSKINALDILSVPLFLRCPDFHHSSRRAVSPCATR